MEKCSRCGKVAKQAGHIVGGVCVSKAACKKRRDRQPQYGAGSWSSPSFEQMMST